METTAFTPSGTLPEIADAQPGSVSKTTGPHPSPPQASPDGALPQASVSPTDGHSWMEFASLQKLYHQLPQSVRDTCTTCWNGVNKMSTPQKVASAAALAGLGYLALRSSKQPELAAGRVE